MGGVGRRILSGGVVGVGCERGVGGGEVGGGGGGCGGEEQQGRG